MYLCLKITFFVHCQILDKLRCKLQESQQKDKSSSGEFRKTTFFNTGLGKVVPDQQDWKWRQIQDLINMRLYEYESSNIEPFTKTLDLTNSYSSCVFPFIHDGSKDTSNNSVASYNKYSEYRQFYFNLFASKLRCTFTVTNWIWILNYWILSLFHNINNSDTWHRPVAQQYWRSHLLCFETLMQTKTGKCISKSFKHKHNGSQLYWSNKTSRFKTDIIIKKDKKWTF